MLENNEESILRRETLLFGVLRTDRRISEIGSNDRIGEEGVWLRQSNAKRRSEMDRNARP